MAGLLDILRGLSSGGGAQTGIMSAGSMGQIKRGPDGKNYQYAETTGMMGDKGGQGWIETSMQPSNSQFRERLSDMMAGLAMGSDPNKSIAGAGMMIAQGNQLRRKEQKGLAQANKTVEWLKSTGVGDQEAAYLATDPDALKAWYTEYKSGSKPDWVITDLFNDKGQKIKAMVDKKTGNYNQIGGAEDKTKSGDVEYGLNPQYGVDKDGNPVIVQLSKAGTSQQTKLPDGVSLSKEPIKLDAGTHFVLLDPITRQPVGTVPKENMQAAKDTAIGTAQGKAQGDAQVGLGSALTKADQSIGLIDTMLQHPGLDTAVGASSVWDPRNYMAGTDATNFNVMRKQLEGKAFLEAFESLKGAGQITEVEGTKATEAIARLSTAQSEKAYKDALVELKGILEQGKQRSIQKAGGTPQSGQAPAGVDAAVWAHMTPEERALWVN